MTDQVTVRDECPEDEESVETEGSVETHLHGRNPVSDRDGRMEMVAESAVDEHEVIILIGNTLPVLLTQHDVDVYLPKFEQSLPQREFMPQVLAAPLLTDATTPEMVREMRRRRPRNVANLKGFMAGVSNDGGHSVSDVRKLAPTLHACHDDSVDAPRLPVDWHFERARWTETEDIEMRDREWESVKHDFAAVLEVDPDGTHTPKHISDERTLNFLHDMRMRGYDVYGELAPQYFVRTHEDLYKGPGGKGTAFRANELVWPIFKAAPSKRRLRTTAVAGLPYIHYGGDISWHIDDPTKESGVKITCEGFVCGGIAMLPSLAKSIVIDLFVEAGAKEHLDTFFSRVARKKLGLGPARTKMVYVRKPWRVPDVFTGQGPDGEIKVHPFMKGEMANWKQVAKHPI